MRNRLAFASIITAFFALTANASLQMYLDKSFTIPGTNPISQLQFADWDGDGIPEVAALSADSDVVIYSITGDSVIFSYRNDLIPANPVSILFADVTRDSIPDLVLQYLVSAIIDGKQTEYVMDVLDGAQSFARIKRYLYYSAQFPIRSASYIRAIDLDGDRFNEFVVSRHKVVEHYSYDEDIVFDTYDLVTYTTLPDTLPMPGGIDSTFLVQSGDESFKVEYRTDHGSHWGSGSNWEFTSVYFRITDIRSGFASTIYGGGYPPCSGEFTSSTSVARFNCAGDIWPGGGSTEVFVAKTGSQSCYSTVSGVNVAGWQRVLGRLTESGAFETIWSDSSFDFIGGKIVTHPLFPFSAIGLTNAEILLFSFLEKSVIERIPLPAASLKEWDSPYSDDRLRLVTIDGRKVELWGFDEATGVVDPPIAILPERFELSNPYPNPFNPSVTIDLAIPAKGRVRLDVFNLTGQRVATIFDEIVSAGTKTIPWNASGHSSGVYFFRATFEEQSQTVKAILLK